MAAALQRTQVITALKGSLKRNILGGTTPGGSRERGLLLGVQIAICTLLVTASLVAARGMVSALHAPLGFQPTGAKTSRSALNSLRVVGTEGTG